MSKGPRQDADYAQAVIDQRREDEEAMKLCFECPLESPSRALHLACHGSDAPKAKEEKAGKR